MSIEFLQYLHGIATGYFVELTAPTVGGWIKKALGSNNLSNKFTEAQNSEQLEEAINELVGVIEGLAQTGEIEIDNATLEAAKSISFDHNDGIVTLKATTLISNKISIGGSGKGLTKMVDVKSATPNTKIEGKGGAKITFKGNARIDQNG